MFNYTYLNGVAFANSVPKEDSPSLEWITQLVNVIAKLALNEADVAALLLDMHVDKEPLDGKLARFKNELGALITNSFDFLRSAKYLSGEYISIGKTPAQSLQQYQQFFEIFSSPASHWDDHLFARMTLAGPLPNKLEQIHCLPDELSVTNAHYQSAMGQGDTLDEALHEGRIFLWDFRLFDGVKGGTFPLNEQKFIGSPLALFAIAKVGTGARQLTPVAIQCFKSKDPANPIFTPANGMAWEMAKMTVRSAAANYHQVVAHFSHTHLVIEAFAVSARRQLHPRHPIMHLLDPHIEGTLFINKIAHEQLLRPGGGVDSVMAPEIGVSRKLVCKAIEEYDFDAAMFPTVMAALGVDDRDILPEYPYRDDASLLWNAISAWVETYVAIYYKSDIDVVGDPELQAWWHEVSDMDHGGRIGGMSQMTSIDYLSKSLTHLIFTASCQHASVNFPQGDFMSLVTNMPTALYSYPPTRLDGYTEKDLYALLPPLHAVQTQLNLAILLGTVNFTRLGDYSTELPDPKVEPALKQFQETLKEIEETIKLRNQVRIPYCYLLPSRIPQSVNI
ncbi:MAG: lipoxygenase family protein [Rhodoluna sp.]